MQRACIQKGAFLTATFQKPFLPVFLNIFRNRKTVGIQTTNMPMCSSQIGGKTAWGSIPRNDARLAVRLKIKPPVAIIRSVFISISSILEQNVSVLWTRVSSGYEKKSDYSTPGFYDIYKGLDNILHSLFLDILICKGFQFWK